MHQPYSSLATFVKDSAYDEADDQHKNERAELSGTSGDQAPGPREVVPRTVRRRFKTAEFSDEEVEMIVASRMDARHADLDKLLDRIDGDRPETDR